MTVLAPPRKAMYLIWSIEHGRWWRAHECGYTERIEDAGVYTERDSDRILRSANRVTVNEARIPLCSTVRGAERGAEGE